MLTTIILAWILHELSAPFWMWILLMIRLVARMIEKIAEWAD